MKGEGSAGASPHQGFGSKAQQELRPTGGLVALPAEVVNAAPVRPLLGLWDQPFSHRVLPHVLPFFGVAFVISQAMMPSTGLPSPIWILVLFAELALPKGYPGFDRY